MKISVYLGSATECKPEYNDLAYALGRAIALAGHTLVYGGADVGTMHYLAEGAQNAGGEVVGVFPRGFLGTIEVQKAGIKVMRDGLTEMVLTADFAERKKEMERRSDLCVVMPGSYGTLDELFTYACNKTIGEHCKPIILLNHKGFYEPIRQMEKNIDEAGFLKPSARGLLTFCSTVEEVINIIPELCQK